MARSATSRLKVNPPLGRMPVLQFVQPGELGIDEAYQRSIETGPSQTLIRKIAQHWNWDLCQPLVVAQREGGELMVIDGQHRLAAARMRGDIAQLPCVIVRYESAADEAASFVHLNQQRRSLSKLDLFKAAVASEDPEACAILNAMDKAGLTIAPTTNPEKWKSGMVTNIGGIERAWRQHGARVVERALCVLAEAFRGQVLRYAGTIFPGIAAICAVNRDAMEGTRLITMLASRSQVDWRNAMMAARTEDPNLRFAAASAKVIEDAWRQMVAVDLTPQAPSAKLPDLDRFRQGKAFCEQCDLLVTLADAEACCSRFCKVKVAA